MGRENRLKNLQTRLNEQTNLCKLQHATQISNYQTKLFQKPCKVQSKLSISSTDTIFQPASCSKIHNQNSCFITQITKEEIKLHFLVNKSIFERDPVFVMFHRCPRQSSILPALTIASGNYHQFHHTKRLLKI